jgi:pimeloyl-ACP methyl ester carboxylesterase
MQISANGIALEVEDHGSPSGEPLVLIMGLGMQLVAWHPGFVAMLVARGFRVIRFDNRDIGLSQRFDHLGVPNLAIDSLRYAVGMKVAAPYTVADWPTTPPRCSRQWALPRHTSAAPRWAA